MATIINSPRDPNTLSNYNNWILTHITANFDILFDQKKLAGNVVHQLKSITDAQSQDIILDANHLDIGDVKVDGKQSQWELLPPLESYGTALKIKLGHAVKLNETIEVDVRHSFRIVIMFAFNINLYKKISVKTTEKCTALQWLTPAQTSNKKYPYMCKLTMSL